MALQHQQIIQRLIPSLRSRNEEERNRAAKELFHVVSSDLREISAEELSAVLDHLTKQMLDNVKVCTECQARKS